MRSRRRAFASLVVGGAVIAGIAIAAADSGGTTHTASTAPAAANGTADKLLASVDQAEFCNRAATGHFTSNLEDLDLLDSGGLIRSASEARLMLQVVAGTSQRTFLARVTGGGADDFIHITRTLIDQSTTGPGTLITHCPYTAPRARRLLHG
jgi:hypothetical protein